MSYPFVTHTDYGIAKYLTVGEIILAVDFIGTLKIYFSTVGGNER